MEAKMSWLNAVAVMGFVLLVIFGIACISITEFFTSRYKTLERSALWENKQRKALASSLAAFHQREDIKKWHQMVLKQKIRSRLKHLQKEPNNKLPDLEHKGLDFWQDDNETNITWPIGCRIYPKD